MAPKVCSQNGIMSIGGVSIKEIAAKCGTPVYVYDEQQLIDRMQEFRKYFSSPLFSCQVLYASKAFNCKAMIELCQKYGLGLDVVSGGELYTTMQTSFNLKNVYFHGNNKSDEELRMAMEAGVGTVVLDNAQEANRLIAIASQYPHTSIDVLLRVNPGIEAHTHQYIQTAYIDSKFGISILKMEEIIALVEAVEMSENVNFAGFHCHIGSQIFNKDSFLSAVSVMCRFIADFQKQSGFQVSVLDLGGGFAAWYTEEDEPIEISEICQEMIQAVAEKQKEYGLFLKKLCIEPGRSIVGNAGYEIYTVGDIKQTQNKKYVFINGGMTDNIRPALYQARYSADVATNMDGEKTDIVTIAGKCCESGDKIAEDIPLQPCKRGDLIVVHTTGAYGYSMASNYNKLPLPGVVFAYHGKLRWVIRPQSIEDMISRECDVEII